MTKKKEVTIYGAGMSGLVAAINLARDGYDVTVHDREKDYGGDPLYNPSVHTTPISPKKTSEYIGIDITSAFHPQLILPSYFHETKVNDCPPASGEYTVERGNRPTSLDSLLYPMACDLGVNFKFNSPLKTSDLDHLEPGTIIACGLTPSVYDMFGIPYRKWYGYVSRGEIGLNCQSWMWWDEGITEYGYLSACNNYYFNLLFSTKPVSKETLTKYESFMKRRQGIEHNNWDYVVGAVPVADLSNPQLTRRGMIFCGTIAGFMDPFCWFGINGALTSGKIAAMAISDPVKAQSEFTDFTRYYKTAFRFKKYLWYPLIRPNVTLLENIVKMFGPAKVSEFLTTHINEQKYLPFSIPGYANVGARNHLI